MTTTAVLPALDGCENPADDSFSAQVQVSLLEFQATLQLLVERARFLTAASGVSIALAEGGAFTYCASSGCDSPDTGGTADTKKDTIQRCLESREPIRDRAGDTRFTLVVAIERDGKLAGFFELFGQAGFEERDVEALVRLAEMVITAIDHRDAAARAGNHAFQGVLEVPTGPRLWHAAESLPAAPSQAALAQPQAAPAPPVAAADVHKCAACGFPVSPGRRLCVECDQREDLPRPLSELFSAPHPQESWIKAHGYTIASLVVTALTVAIILWLR